MSIPDVSLLGTLVCGRSGWDSVDSGGFKFAMPLGSAVGWLWELDGWIVVAGVLCAVSASLLGNFSVLRGNSLIGDAISHAVLPGLAAAFLISGSRQSGMMFIGAVIVGILTAVLTQWLRQAGRVDEGAALGVAFTTLFAIGLIMITQAADRVDLDPECVLYGAIELTPLDTWTMFGLAVPRVVIMLSFVLSANLLFVVLFFKELRLASFDPAMADAIGLPRVVLNYVLMILVAVTAVASFESVGILVVAMFVVPAATARLLADSLSRMVVVSAVIAAACGVLGHLAAITLPRLVGFSSTTTAGMMSVVAGALFVLTVVAAPKQGILAGYLRAIGLARAIVRDDVLALLFRHREQHGDEPLAIERIRNRLSLPPGRVRRALSPLVKGGLLIHVEGGVLLTDAGQRAAQPLVRAHRLWEQYLVEQAGMDRDHIHLHAEMLEHVADRPMRDELERATDYPQADPHGSPIPREE